MSEVVKDLEEAKRVLSVEINGLENLKEKIGPDFSKAVTNILNCAGKVIVTGIGKSGIIARKLASTFTSTGTPSLYLHPAESSHGDLGIITSSDLVIAISYGGESSELTSILAYCARKNIPLISMTGNLKSSLAKNSTITLDISVSDEACPMGLAPTTSTTVTLGLSDALAMAVLKRRGFGPNDFAEFHPGGALGRRLLTRVKDVMHVGDSLPLVKTEDKMSYVISLMTAKEVRGVAGVIDNNGQLVGIITDGDIRRRLEKDHQIFSETASQVMSKNPKTIDQDELAEKALFVMEQFRIQILFALDKTKENSTLPVGIIHLQDLLRMSVR